MFERIIISLDGMRTVHEAVRGSDTFRYAVETCRQLTGAGIPVTIAFHAGRHNKKDLAGLAELAAGLGADLKMTPLRPLGRALVNLSDAVLSPEEHLLLAKEVVRLRRLYSGLRLLCDFDILNPGHEEAFAITDEKTACGAGRNLVNIAYTGDVYPCAFFITPDRAFSAGNIVDRPLKEIWSNAPVFESFRVHTKSETCQACPHYRLRCAGGCPAVAHFTQQAMDAHDPFCFAHLTEHAP